MRNRTTSDESASKAAGGLGNSSISTLVMATFILSLTASLALLQSNCKLMWIDEFLGFYTAHQPSFLGVLHVQLTGPYVLEPPTFDLLEHASMAVFGAGAFAMRLPSILSLLVMQICVFGIVRRIAGARAGCFAMLFPLLIHAFDYASEGRPYALLLACMAAGLYCWQSAARTDGQRRLLLSGLAISQAVAITSHYYGLLVVVPVLAGELVRATRARRIDWPVAAAMLLGCSSVLLDLPFREAVLVYRAHINSVPDPGAAMIYLTYSWAIFKDPYRWNTRQLHLGLMALDMIFLSFVVGKWRYFPPPAQSERLARRATDNYHEWIAIATTAFLPVFAVLFGRFVTHAYFPRYGIEAVVGLDILAALSIGPLLENRARYYILISATLVLAIALNVGIARGSRVTQQATLEAIHHVPDQARVLMAKGTPPIFIPSSLCFTDSYYVAGDFSNPIACVYSFDIEMRLFHHDTGYLTAQRMMLSTPTHWSSYEQLKAQRPPRILVVGQDDEEWIEAPLRDEHAALTPLGRGLGGEMYQVAFPSDPAALAAR